MTTTRGDLFDNEPTTERYPGCVCTVAEPHNPGECDCPCIGCTCPCDWRCETEGPFKDDYLACCCDCPHHSKSESELAPLENLHDGCVCRVCDDAPRDAAGNITTDVTMEVPTIHLWAVVHAVALNYAGLDRDRIGQAAERLHQAVEPVLAARGITPSGGCHHATSIGHLDDLEGALASFTEDLGPDDTDYVETLVLPAEEVWVLAIEANPIDTFGLEPASGLSYRFPIVREVYEVLDMCPASVWPDHA